MFLGLVLGLVAVGYAVWCSVGGLSIERRQQLTDGAMGISKRKRKMQSHGVLDTSTLKSLEDYYKTLKRDDRATFLKIDAVFERNNLVVQTASYTDIGFDHFKVIFSHERKVYSYPRALVASCMRFLAISFMVGSLDHFYVDNKLVAFSHTIIKGNTLRAMWFYQRQEVSRCSIWFYAVRKAISRAIAIEGVQYVDLGPSLNAKVKESKQKLNFVDTLNWNELCDYSGDFKFHLVK